MIDKTLLHYLHDYSSYYYLFYTTLLLKILLFDKIFTDTEDRPLYFLWIWEINMDGILTRRMNIYLPPHEEIEAWKLSDLF